MFGYMHNYFIPGQKYTISKYVIVPDHVEGVFLQRDKKTEIFGMWSICDDGYRLILKETKEPEFMQIKP
jgi:hypothetical protein